MSGLPELREKVAVVTGGASGIGRGIATMLRNEGMTVVIADVEDGPLKETTANLGVAGIRTDVSDVESMERLAREVVERYGAVHVVCNNAGIGGSARIADLKLSDWRWTLNVNLWGVIHGVTIFLPILLANDDGGYIVNTASMAGLRGRTGLGAYTVSKYGVVALSETLAAELAEDGSKVGVSVLCPGLVRTNIGNFLRNRPKEFADGSFGHADVTATASREMRSAASRFRRIEPDEAGALVVRAIKRGDLYVLTDPDMFPEFEGRYQRIATAFREAAAFRSSSGSG
jgi:NAD(P)-dependent dehydrogenase (short-subunit alcohol dehydrogenase family)